MSITDYVVDILLILVIFRAVRPHPLTPRAAVLPVVLLAIAGVIYLRPVTLRGNDLALIAILTAAGIVLGALSGLADNIWRDRRCPAARRRRRTPPAARSSRSRSLITGAFMRNGMSASKPAVRNGESAGKHAAGDNEARGWG